MGSGCGGSHRKFPAWFPAHLLLDDDGGGGGGGAVQDTVLGIRGEFFIGKTWEGSSYIVCSRNVCEKTPSGANTQGRNFFHLYYIRRTTIHER